MLPTGFESAIPTTERPHTSALERTATGIGDNCTKRKYSCIKTGSSDICSL